MNKLSKALQAFPFIKFVNYSRNHLIWRKPLKKSGWYNLKKPKNARVAAYKLLVIYNTSKYYNISKLVAKDLKVDEMI